MFRRLIATSRVPQSTVLNMLRWSGKIEPKIDQIRAWLSRGHPDSGTPSKDSSWALVCWSTAISKSILTKKTRWTPTPPLGSPFHLLCEHVPSLFSYWWRIPGRHSWFVLPHTKPAWNPHLNTCISSSSRDGGSSLESQKRMLCTSKIWFHSCRNR